MADNKDSTEETVENHDNEEEIEAASEEEEIVAESEEEERKNEKKNKAGIIYLSTIPPGLTVESIRQIFSGYGELGRIYLEPEGKGKVWKKTKNKNHWKYTSFVEGWVEFKKKKTAKQVALSLNNTLIGGKRKNKYYDYLWSIKYLHRFKWAHLSEKLAYEKVAHQQRMRTEISQVKRETDYYIQNVAKNNWIKTFSHYHPGEKRESVKVMQRETDQEIRERKSWVKRPKGMEPQGPDRELLKSIFGGGDS